MLALVKSWHTARVGLIINRTPHPPGSAINGFARFHSLQLVLLMRKMVSFRSQRFFMLPEARRKLLVPPRHPLHVSDSR